MDIPITCPNLNCTDGRIFEVVATGNPMGNWNCDPTVDEGDKVSCCGHQLTKEESIKIQEYISRYIYEYDFEDY